MSRCAIHFLPIVAVYVWLLNPSDALAQLPASPYALRPAAAGQGLGIRDQGAGVRDVFAERIVARLEPRFVPPPQAPAAVDSLPGRESVGAGGFPALPPDPNAPATELRPLEFELMERESQLYESEGGHDAFAAGAHGRSGDSGHGDAGHGEFPRLRVPEGWPSPQPLTLGPRFLGADPVLTRPGWKWPGLGGYAWEPALVGYGSYQAFGFAVEQNSRRQDAVGHQLIADLDLRLTGTERFHVQFRPLGTTNTGGSYYQFSDPAGYVDNSGGIPDRYWFEGELHSMFSSFLDPFAARDVHCVVGKFPLALHNSLLINDEVRGIALNKNTIYLGTLSNLNLQGFYIWDDVGATRNPGSQLLGVNAFVDWRLMFFEATYLYNSRTAGALGDDVQFAALSGTRFLGPLSVTARGLFKWGDESGRGPGQLLVLESNYTRNPQRHWLGVEEQVFYANAFWATPGWNSVSGANLNRLRTSFEVSPLVRLAAGLAPDDIQGGAVGVQLFRRRQDESWAPEFAYECRQGTPVFGAGLRYQRKLGQRSFLEALGVFGFSSDSRYDREGVFVSHTTVF